MDRPSEDGPAEWRSVMVDVSGLSLAELTDLAERAAGDDTVLARSLRRVAAERAEPGEPIAGFNSAL